METSKIKLKDNSHLKILEPFTQVQWDKLKEGSKYYHIRENPHLLVNIKDVKLQKKIDKVLNRVSLIVKPVKNNTYLIEKLKQKILLEEITPLIASLRQIHIELSQKELDYNTEVYEDIVSVSKENEEQDTDINTVDKLKTKHKQEYLDINIKELKYHNSKLKKDLYKMLKGSKHIYKYFYEKVYFLLIDKTELKTSNKTLRSRINRLELENEKLKTFRLEVHKTIYNLIEESYI